MGHTSYRLANGDTVIRPHPRWVRRFFMWIVLFVALVLAFAAFVQFIP